MPLGGDVAWHNRLGNYSIPNGAEALLDSAGTVHKHCRMCLILQTLSPQAGPLTSIVFSTTLQPPPSLNQILPLPSRICCNRLALSSNQLFIMRFSIIYFAAVGLVVSPQLVSAGLWDTTKNENDNTLIHGEQMGNSNNVTAPSGSDLHKVSANE